MEEATEAERVSIDLNGGSMPAFLCRPVEEERHPAIIVVHQITGLAAHIEDVACRFAAQGYVALAPYLFWQLESLPELTDPSSFRGFRQSLDDRQLLSSLDGALAFLREQDFVDVSHIGIIGFCMGAYYAVLEAASNPTLAACVDFYGSPLPRLDESERHPMSQLEAVRHLRVPFLGIFGEEDASIPIEQVKELKGILQGQGIPFEIHTYPDAGHAFFDDTSPTYRGHAAEDAWPRTLQFLQQHLKR